MSPSRPSACVINRKPSNCARSYQDRGQELFIDQGRTLAIVKHEQQSLTQIAAALAVAQQKYGMTLTVTGSDNFKRQAVAAAIEHDLKVRFSDPTMEAQRVQMTQASRQAADFGNYRQQEHVQKIEPDSPGMNR